MKREVYTFSPGPCIFPLEVLQETQNQIKDPQHSILEYTTNSPRSLELVEECKSLFRTLLKIPSNFSLFFTCGGATQQFASIPMNLLNSPQEIASYIVNGTWSNLAINEAKNLCQVHLANSFQPKKDWNYAPKLKQSDVNPQSKYLYYCDNETVHGIEFPQPPSSFGIDLVTDMTSNFLTKPVDFSKFALVYSGAQKNWGPSGLCLIIIRNDLLSRKGLPQKLAMMNFSELNKCDLDNYPVPIFSLFVARNTLKWLIANGGLSKMQELSAEKSRIIYETIDNSNGFYQNRIQKDSRSRVNLVCHLIGDDKALTQAFVKEALGKGILQVGGHVSVGGLRFSIYNGMPMDGVLRLRDHMIAFQKKHENKPKL